MEEKPIRPSPVARPTTPPVTKYYGGLSPLKSQWGRQQSDDKRSRQEIMDNKNTLDSRDGAVLDRRYIIKVDQFPRQSQKNSSSNNLSSTRISGAPKFRVCGQTNIFAVAQPTVFGIRGICNMLNVGYRKRPQSSRVLWVNLREEPLLYINGRPVVLRERAEPFHNISTFHGISKERIESLEWRLKRDVALESERFDGNILIHEEVNHKEIEMSWEATPMGAIQTPEEAFAMLKMEGYSIDYVRVPLTAEQPPSKHFFDQLLQCIMSCPSDAAIVFNCHTGFTRSTFAMVAACLTQMWRGAINAPLIRNNSLGETISSDGPRTLGMQPVASPAPKQQTVKSPKMIRVLSGATLSSIEAKLEIDMGAGADYASTDYTARQLLAGWYQPILGLLRLLENGGEVKAHVDHFCDISAHLVNLRTVIFFYRSKASQARSKVRGRYKIRRAHTSLQRYSMLMLYNAYLSDQVQRVMDSESAPPFVGAGPTFSMTFNQWIQSRPELMQWISDLGKNAKESLQVLDPQSLFRSVSAIQEVEQPEEVQEMERAMLKRRGSVLNTDTILKADQFPSGLDTKNANKFDVVFRGAPNFRMVPGTKVHGVCTPTISAAEQILRYCVAAYGAKKIIWTNLREEPIVYINERPFVLRSIGKPFENVRGFGSIEADRLQDVERRLKEDVIAEAKKYGGKILVHSESEERSLQVYWENVSEDDVLTPLEVYQRFIDTDLPVVYKRIPLTPEEPPSPEDISDILSSVRETKSHAETHYVYNCQMGRGRSTVSMVLACTELDESSNEFFPYLKEGHTNGGELQLERRSTNRANEQEYSAILSLVRVLDGGVAAKRWVDNLVDLCGAVENIRGAVEVYRQKATTARSEDRAEDHVERALLNLRRYFMLVVVGSYQYQRNRASQKGEDAPVNGGVMRQSFAEWFADRPELKTLYHEIEGKMSLQHAAVDKVLSAPPPIPEGVQVDDVGDIALAADESELVARYVARRNGMVLVKGSILKSDHFPGCNRIPGDVLKLTGAPNFRKVGLCDTRVQGNPVTMGLDVYGTGIPTVSGMELILEHILGEEKAVAAGTDRAASAGAETAKPGKEQSKNGRCVVWINLREEPILYVRGLPYVLRKMEHPFGNLEHTGISKERVEAMEMRLKRDVLQEIADNEGRILLHDEDESGLMPTWQDVDVGAGSLAVMTPKDVYLWLQSRGYDVCYYRVPITDEQAPKVADVDHIMNIVKQSPMESKVVLNCQMGRGRTTTGVVIACCTRLWMQGKLQKIHRAVDEMEKGGFTFYGRTRRGGDAAGEAFASSSSVEAMCLRGEYKGVSNMVKLISNGQAAKDAMDAVIDLCDIMQNLREAIYDLKVRSESTEIGPVHRATAESRGVHYMRRYYLLVQFSAYCFSAPFTSFSAQTQDGYESWLQGRHELKNIARRLNLEV